MALIITDANKFIDKNMLNAEFIQSEIPRELFDKWKDAQDLRNYKVGSKTDVDLSKETKVVYFKKETVGLILSNPRVTYIVIKFGTLGSVMNGFSQLTAAIQGRDNHNNQVTETYIGNLNKNGAPNSIPEKWITKNEDDFLKRNEIINKKQYSNEFKNEPGGIKHKTSLFNQWFSTLGEIDDIAFYFIYDYDKTTVALVDAKFNPKISASSYNLYDQGNRCCP